jgi:diguanylate cyclase (GGDEF)-like protein
MVGDSTQAVHLVVPSLVRQKPMVLHVDDDIACLVMAEGALKDAGFEVIQAANGQEAIDSFKKHDPDIIIMDAVMPVLDGFDAIRGIRQLNGGEHVPILMITGLYDLDSITRAYDEGATDFSTKPLNYFILPHRVQYMLRSKQTADELRSSQAKLDNAQRIAHLGNWEWSLSSNDFFWSREFGRVLCFEENTSPETWSEFLHLIDEPDRSNVQLIAEQSVEQKQTFNVEFSIVNWVDGSTRRLRLEAEPHCQEDGDYMLGTVQDITERINDQEQIHNLAYYDLVTGLPNRAQLSEQLRYTLKQSKRNNSKFSVLFLDLDHFKQVNDTLGHDAGDELLQQVANRLTSVVRETDMISGGDDDDSESKHTVARLGGDEFVVLLGVINRAEDAARVAERIAQAVRMPYELGSNTVNVTTTIGISVYPADGEDFESMMKSADIAMYHAKESGRNGYQFYSRSIHEQALTRFSLEADLRVAIETDQLTLAYQPKIDMETGELSGVEALTRWMHPEKGIVNPSEFILLAEETGLIISLGRWVLRQACEQMQRWVKSGWPPMVMAVNYSSVQITKSNVIEDISEAISVSGLDPKYLEIELTESLLLQDGEKGIQVIKDMKALGIQVAIDDFGTGFSSLSYLKRLPVDKLKIDQSFVDNLAKDNGDAAIVTAIITLGHNLDLKVVAEGVETQEQFDILRGFKCNEAQGYLISSPLEIDDLETWINNYHAGSLDKVSGM